MVLSPVIVYFKLHLDLGLNHYLFNFLADLEFYSTLSKQQQQKEDRRAYLWQLRTAEGKDGKNERIKYRLFSDGLNSSEEIRRSTILSLWLPFLECLWNWSDFVTPHPMAVPVHSEPSKHRMFCIKVYWGSIEGRKVLAGRNTAPTFLFTYSLSSLEASKLPPFTKWLVTPRQQESRSCMTFDLVPSLILLCASSLCDWP